MEKSEVEGMLPDLLGSVFGEQNVSDEVFSYCVGIDEGLASVVLTDDYLKINGASIGGVEDGPAFFQAVAGYGQQFPLGTPVYWEGGSGNFNLLIQTSVPYSLLGWEYRPSLQFLVNTIQTMAEVGYQFANMVRPTLGGTLLSPAQEPDRAFFAMHAGL